MSLLDDLDLDPDDLDRDSPTGVVEVTEPEWTGPPHLRPVPVFVGDWFASALDAGLPYGLLLANVERFAVHQAPPTEADLPRRQRGTVRRPDVDIDRPLHTSIALARAADETDREHLARLGRQVRVFDMPDAQPFFGPARYQSIFDGCDLAAADMTALAVSPLTVDRLVLTTRMSTGADVLDRLSYDPAVGVRVGVASHSNIDVRTAVRLLADDHDDVYASAMTNPCIDDTVKETAARERRGIDLLTAKRVLSITHPVSSVSLVSARP